MYIGELAKRAGATPKAIRLYESLGLLGRVVRMGAYRVYNDKHVTQVRLIKQAQTMGFKLADVGASMDGGNVEPNWSTMAEQVEQRRAEIAVEIVRLQQFDVQLHGSNPHHQALKPDLLAVQNSILWAQHIAWVFPVWWGGVPALMKGFLDRAFTSGWAYKFTPGSLFPVPLLKGRTAHLLVPMDTPPWYYRWVYRMPVIHQMRKTTLMFCGIRPTGTLMLGPIIHSTADQRGDWLQKAGAMGGRCSCSALE